MLTLNGHLGSIRGMVSHFRGLHSDGISFPGTTFIVSSPISKQVKGIYKKNPTISRVIFWIIKANHSNEEGSKHKLGCNVFKIL